VLKFVIFSNIGLVIAVYRRVMGRSLFLVNSSCFRFWYHSCLH